MYYSWSMIMFRVELRTRYKFDCVPTGVEAGLEVRSFDVSGVFLGWVDCACERI